MPSFFPFDKPTFFGTSPGQAVETPTFFLPDRALSLEIRGKCKVGAYILYSANGLSHHIPQIGNGLLITHNPANSQNGR